MVGEVLIYLSRMFSAGIHLLSVCLYVSFLAFAVVAVVCLLILITHNTQVSKHHHHHHHRCRRRSPCSSSFPPRHIPHTTFLYNADRARGHRTRTRRNEANAKRINEWDVHTHTLAVCPTWTKWYVLNGIIIITIIITLRTEQNEKRNAEQIDVKRKGKEESMWAELTCMHSFCFLFHLFISLRALTGHTHKSKAQVYIRWNASEPAEVE